MKFTVAGVYVERDRALLVRAEARRIHPNSPWAVEYIDHATTTWSTEDHHQARGRLIKLIQVMKSRSPEIESLSIAAYGPFLSLLPSDLDGYGKVHPKRAHLPLRGANYVEIAQEGLGNTNQNAPPYFNFHTDASACAIGEAMSRDLPLGKVIASIVVGKGIGLGLAQNYTPLPSALHPEIGLIPAAPLDEEKYFGEVDTDFTSLAQRVDNDSMCKRAGIPISDGDDHPEALFDIRDERLWDLRAQYLAQACLACAAICPPNAISIHAYVDPLGDVGDRTSGYFQDLLNELKLAEQPVFKYENLQDPNFITNTRNTEPLPGASAIASTGAMGMCYAAAENAFSQNLRFADLTRTIRRGP